MAKNKGTNSSSKIKKADPSAEDLVNPSAEDLVEPLTEGATVGPEIPTELTVDATKAAANAKRKETLQRKRDSLEKSLNRLQEILGELCVGNKETMSLELKEEGITIINTLRPGAQRASTAISGNSIRGNIKAFIKDWVEEFNKGAAQQYTATTLVDEIVIKRFAEGDTEKAFRGLGSINFNKSLADAFWYARNKVVADEQAVYIGPGDIPGSYRIWGVGEKPDGFPMK